VLFDNVFACSLCTRAQVVARRDPSVACYSRASEGVSEPFGAMSQSGQGHHQVLAQATEVCRRNGAVRASVVFVPYSVIWFGNVNQQNALFKLMFQFNSFCLLHVSNILWPSSGRLCCIYSLIWYVFYAFLQSFYQCCRMCSSTASDLLDCLHIYVKKNK